MMQRRLEDIMPEHAKQYLIINRTCWPAWSAPVLRLSGREPSF